MELTLDEALQKAVEAHKAGQIQEAERLYTAILQARPKHPDANHNMGVLAVGVGKIQEALPFFKTALEANLNIGQYWLSCIDALIKLDRITDAKAVFDQAKEKGISGEAFDQLEASLNPNNATGASPEAAQLIKKATVYRESGDFATAIQLLTDHLVEFPGSAELLSLLAHCYMLNDDAENASIYLIKANEIDSDNVSVSWNNVRQLLRKKNVPDALMVARKTIERYPNDIEGMSVLGSCLRLGNEFDESLLYLNKALLLNPNYAEALINRGLIKLTQKDKLGALSDLETAHKLKPHMKQIWDLVINLNVEFKRFEQAISFLGPMVKSNSSNEKYFANLGLCYQHLGHSETAIENYQRALEIKPDSAEVYNNIGIILGDKGDFEAAINSYKQALKIKPDYVDAYFNMGIALQDKGDLEAAINSYKQTLNIKPDYAEAYNNMGIAMFDKGDLEAAINSYKQALKIKPDYADAYFNMGIALFDKDDVDTAIYCYKQALKIKPGYAEAYHNMGNALLDKGDLEASIESYEEALKIKPDYAEACAGILSLLTFYAPLKGVSHSNIVKIDQEIRSIDIQGNALNIIHDDQIVNLYSESSNYISNYGLELRTDLSQTYRSNAVDLNCKRHMSVFNDHDIIPEFCFGCYKVQVEPRSIIDLIKLYVVFDQLHLKENNTRKCMVELRPEIPGFYKGLIYCSGLKQANQIAEYLNRVIKGNIGSGLSAKIKRGCSEYSFSFPNYKKINNSGPQLMNYTEGWKVIEDDHDRKKPMEVRENLKPSLSGLNLNDVLIMRKWFDYARGIGDSSVHLINYEAVQYPEVYSAAKARLGRHHFTN